MKFLESFFEGALWNSRFVVIFAVVSSLAAGFAIFSSLPWTCFTC